MKLADLAELTVAKLRTLAKKSKVVLSATAKKDDIIKAIMRAAAPAGGAAKKKAAATKAGAAKTGAKGAAGKAALKKVVKKKAVVKKSVASEEGAAKAAAVRREPVSPAPREVRAAAKPARCVEIAGEWQVPTGAGDQERVAGAKYFTGPQGEGAVAPTLPAGYGDERIVILSRDPSVLFGYWEVPQARIDQERARVGTGSKLCVRIYDITGVSFDGSNATATFDQEVYERVGSWYFHLARPAHCFCADIGLLAPGGGFHTLHRSNVVSMPRETVSEATDDRWAVSDEQFLRLHGLSRGIGGLSSAQMQELFRAARMHEISSQGLFSRLGPAAKSR